MTARPIFQPPDADNTPLSAEQLEQLIALQSNLLSATVCHDNFEELLDKLCQYAEKLTENAVASVMVFDDNREQLNIISAPSIPPEAIEDLNGLRAGEELR